jgi:hypothetical protein
MSSKWSWTFGILTASGFLLTLLIWAPSQQPTGRDWSALTIGAALGGTTAALISTFIFHAHPRMTGKATPSTTSTSTARPAPARGFSIAVPGRTEHGKLTASLNMETGSHLVRWKSNKRVAGRLDPAEEGDGWVVLYGSDLQQQKFSSPEGERLGAAESLAQGMEMIEARASKTS